MKPTLKLLPVALMTLGVTACGGSSSDDDRFSYDASAMIDNLTHNIIVAGYAELDSKAGELITALDVLQTTQNGTNLEAAQDAWKATRQPWEQGEAHIFGPVDTLEIDPHLDTWPLNTTDLTTLVNSTDPDFSTLNDDIQGFHAMEFLLFGDGVSSNTRAATLSVNERAYLAALSNQFASYTGQLHDAWVTEFNDGEAYQNYLLTPGNTLYSGQVDIVKELIDALTGIVDEVGNGKIADPFGTSSADANTSLVESQYSWNSLTDFANNIKGVQNVYRGETGTSSPVCNQGLCDFIAAADEALAERLDAEIQAAIDAIENIAGSTNMPFRTAITDNAGRVRIQAAIDALATLQSSLETDAVAVLNRWNGA